MNTIVTVADSARLREATTAPSCQLTHDQVGNKSRSRTQLTSLPALLSKHDQHISMSCCSDFAEHCLDVVHIYLLHTRG